MSRAPALSAVAAAGGGDGCGGGGGGGWAAAWDEWQCPVCMELVDKPTVSECGHVSCFWCHHHSMNSLGPTSPCPLCRHPRAALPGPCAALHAHLLAAFPEEAARRRDDMAAEYEGDGGSSARVEPTDVDKALDCVACARCLRGATVLTCGHSVCITCVPRAAAGVAEAPAACPACGIPVLGESARFVVCKKLDDLVKAVRPLDYAQREREAEAEACACDGGVGGAAGRVVGTPAIAGAEAAAEGAATDGGLESAGVGGGGGRDVETYIHFNVGCDACGSYPIVGARYRCMDCPERVGFDLCGTCHRAGLHSVPGRFGQHHTPEHRMRRVDERRTLVHAMLAANREVLPETLQWMLEMQMDELLPMTGPAPQDGDDESGDTYHESDDEAMYDDERDGGRSPPGAASGGGDAGC